MVGSPNMSVNASLGKVPPRLGRKSGFCPEVSRKDSMVRTTQGSFGLKRVALVQLSLTASTFT